MEEKLREKIFQKIDETIKAESEISSIVELFKSLSTNNNSLAFGIALGRLYNSFYYQCRRILKRDPTDEEFSEFIKILKDKESELLEKFNLEK